MSSNMSQGVELKTPAYFEKANGRSRSAQGLTTSVSSPLLKIPMPPKLWITDVSSGTSDDEDPAGPSKERAKARTRYRSQKTNKSSNIPIGFFWDIENCQVPRGCSAIDVVAAIRSKFLSGRREADFVVVCDVRKESPMRLQELNDAQVNLIHVCGTQKNAADEKLRQCMRRFGELHSSPAALVLISGDINFASDLSDFRHRKKMEVILVHKVNTSSALIACANSHYSFNEVTSDLVRYQKSNSQSSEPDGDEGEVTSCEVEVSGVPAARVPERVARRLRRLADNCGGKVLRVAPPHALLRFPTPDHASRALKRMDGEDVFGHKISTRSVRGMYAAPAHAAAPAPLPAPAYSSDEGYGTGSAPISAQTPLSAPPPIVDCGSVCEPWTRFTFPATLPPAEMLPAAAPTPTPALYLPPAQLAPTPASAPLCARRIRGTHGNNSMLDQSRASSSNSADEYSGELAPRGPSPYSSSMSELSGSEPELDGCELSVACLPPYSATVLQSMLYDLFSEHVPVLRTLVRNQPDGPVALVLCRSEADARLAISRLHKKRLDSPWGNKRLELSLGKSSPSPPVHVLKARLRRLLFDQPGYSMPLLRLRDAYANRHSCALTTSDLGKVKDTVAISESYGRMVRLLDTSPPRAGELEDAPWKCGVHAAGGCGVEDGAKILTPVQMPAARLERNVKLLLDGHGGMMPLLSFVECYEAVFGRLPVDCERGVALELLLRHVPGLVFRESPSRHVLTQAAAAAATSHRAAAEDGCDRERPVVAPALGPIMSLFERELTDLLREAPRCSIPFSRFIPAYHHHFGRQCRVADYGFTKLPDLLAAIHNTVVVLGSGSSRVITLTPAAQARRWTNDLVKILKAQATRSAYLQDLPELYQTTFGKPFLPADYGSCNLSDLMTKVGSHAIIQCPNGVICLPRRCPTPIEREKLKVFADQVVELLSYCSALRLEYSKFVPSFQAHFNYQLRVTAFGCNKLHELLDLIPEAVATVTSAGDRVAKLAARPARVVMAERLKMLSPCSVSDFAMTYNARFGAQPLPDILDCDSVESLILAAGGYIENGEVKAPGDCPHWTNVKLMACAVLSGDRSVNARGSTVEYFSANMCERLGAGVKWWQMEACGVVERRGGRVALAASWRAAWRLALLFDARAPRRPAEDLALAYHAQYNAPLPLHELGFESAGALLRQFGEVFVQVSLDGFALCAGVAAPRPQQPPAQPSVADFALFDTPPGHKGSRVWESPAHGIWSSPPASELPQPSLLLNTDRQPWPSPNSELPVLIYGSRN